MHNVTWDYQDPAPESTAGGNQGALFRSNYGTHHRHVEDRAPPPHGRRWIRSTQHATNRRFVVPDGWAPQRWGYNIVRLYPDAGATSVTVTFRGVVQSAANSDLRWGLVATDAGDHQAALQRAPEGAPTARSPSA